MKKLDIVTSVTLAQVKLSNGDGSKDVAIPTSQGKCEELKGHVFNVCIALVIDVFFVTMNELT